VGCRFQQKTCNISETSQDLAKVTVDDLYRKSHARFRLVPKSTTLNDGHYELCFKIRASSETIMNIYINIDPRYQRRRCSPVTLVSGNIRCMRNCGYSRGFPGDGGIKRQWGCRKRQFSVLSLAISSEALEVRPILLYYLVPRRLSTDPKIRDLECPFYVNFCFVAN